VDIPINIPIKKASHEENPRQATLIIMIATIGFLSDNLNFILHTLIRAGSNCLYGGYLLRKRTELYTQEAYKKEARVSSLLLIPLPRLWYAHLPRISNTEAHADDYT
jgi:hypothetical protein